MAWSLKQSAARNKIAQIARKSSLRFYCHFICCTLARRGVRRDGGQRQRRSPALRGRDLDRGRFLEVMQTICAWSDRAWTSALLSYNILSMHDGIGAQPRGDGFIVRACLLY